jgi:hypothetical protein
MSRRQSPRRAADAKARGHEAMTGRLILFPFLLGVAFVLSQEFLYEPFVVPRLSAWKEVPTLWWVLILAPEAAVCIAAALMARSRKEWILFCVAGALVVTTLQWLAAALNQPGHLKLIEGGPEHFVLQFLILSVLLLGVIATIRTLRFAVLRLHAS